MASNNSKSISSIINKYAMEMILLIIFILLSIFANGFLSINNLLNVLRSMAITGVVAFGIDHGNHWR